MKITVKGLFIGTTVVVLLAIITLIVIIKREKYDVMWTENRRNNVSFNKYPPCYDICGSTRNIYDEIERSGKLKEYKKLLDVYSIVLCQVKYINSRNVREMMMDRITELIKFGGDTDERYSGVLGMYPTPYHTIPYHTIPYHTIHHTIPYHTPYHTIPYHTMPYHTIPYTIPYHTIHHTVS